MGVENMSTGERGLSFDQQVALAEALFKAVDDRNVFIQRQGGFDTFAEVGQHVEGMGATHDELEQVALNARREFDEKVFDKKEFVRKLRDVGNDALADTVARMFGVSKEAKESIFSRIFKK